MARSRTASFHAMAFLLVAGAAQAAVAPAPQEKQFKSPGLFIPTRHAPLADLDRKTAESLEPELGALGVPAGGAFYDTLWQRWGSLLPTRPLIPGRGVGNTLSWAQFGIAGEPTDEQIQAVAWDALTGYLRSTPALGVDVEELTKSPRLAVHDGGALIQVHAQRFLSGVPVRDSSVTAVLNSGNLILLGLTNWGDAAPSADPRVTAADARTVVAAHAAPAVLSFARRARLEFVPFSGADGYGYRLVWVVDATSDRDLGTWEGLVDAATGELLAFEDRNQYDGVVKKVIGGIYPVSNDGQPPDGVEVPGFPMPYADALLPETTAPVFATSGGVIGCVAPPPLPNASFLPFWQTTLSGSHVRIADVCGAVRERFHTDTAPAGNLGAGPGTDCAIPALRHSRGDTHAARTTYYEVNRIMEQGRGYLPANTWLQSQVVANTNINNTCNAFWNGSSVNFYRNNGGACRNTGELAGVIDHEWGHGMDNNGVNATIANPGEGIADIHAVYRLASSCMGRGFRATNCGGYGDACTQCTGIREVDWARKVSGQPHGIPWIDANCGTGPAPCGGGVHCEGHVYSEAAWDLFSRDFRGFGGSVFNFDFNTALELSTRLFFIGSGPVTQWFQCTNPNGGCLATAGYLNILAVDDDNGSLADGTPHMTAIFAAFNRHNIACATPVVTNSGCAGGPSAAPVVTATPRDQRVSLSWTPVPGATRYAVYRTEGVQGCNFGKAKVGETTGTTLVDQGLMNGFGYHYAVMAVGASDACRSAMSACVPVTPTPGANAKTLPPGPIQVLGGDGDGILDNCETARLTVVVENNGTAPLTNVRVVSAVSATHPATLPLTPLPFTLAASLDLCDRATGTIDVVPHGMTFDQSFQVTLTITADQIAPETRTVTFGAAGVEMDFQAVASRTYNFNTGFNGWVVASGTFNRVDAGGGDFYLASSSCLDGQCDVARSPVIRLQANSTLSLTQRYDMENPVPIPYDRANVGIFDVSTGARTAVNPDGGDLYDLNPGAANGSCGTELQGGWSADTDADCIAGAAFQASTWTSAALNPGGMFTNRTARLSVNYGTDPGANGYGFHFDNVVLGNFLEGVPDAQACTLQRPPSRELRTELRTRTRSRRSPGRTSG